MSAVAQTTMDWTSATVVAIGVVFLIAYPILSAFGRRKPPRR